MNKSKISRKSIWGVAWFLSASVLMMTYQNCGRGFQTQNEDEMQSISGAFDAALFSGDWDSDSIENVEQPDDFNQASVGVQGFFAVDPHVYFSTDRVNFCLVTDPLHYRELAGVELRKQDILFIKKVPAQMVSSGLCPRKPIQEEPKAVTPNPVESTPGAQPSPVEEVKAPTNPKVKGFFMSGINIYFSNGSEYCKLQSMEQYEQRSGTKSVAGLPSFPQGAQIGLTYAGLCQ